jgi:2-hydroxychromene-2-carboxylate isomerase
MAVIAVATERPDDICRIVREEYERMPRMRLTLPQFRRVWHLSEQESAYVVRALLASGVLVTDPDGCLRLAARAGLHHAA